MSSSRKFALVTGLDETAFALSASSFAASLMHSVFMFYYVKVFLNLYGVSEEWFQICQVLFMVWNAVNDPLLGYIVDHVPWSIHKTRRETILYGAPVFAVSFLVPWFAWSTEPGSWVIGMHLLVSLSFYDTMFTYVLLTAASLNAEISSHHGDRLQRSRYNMVASLLGSSVIFACEYFSHGLDDFFMFRVCCVAIAILAWASMTYTGLKCSTQYELCGVATEGATQGMQSGGDRSTSLSIWKLTWQLLTQRNFLAFVATNLLSEFHNSYLVNFGKIYFESVVPENALSHFTRSCFYGLLVVLPQLVVIFGMPTIGRVGYYKLHMWSFCVKICSGLLMFHAGRHSVILVMLFMTVER